MSEQANHKNTQSAIDPHVSAGAFNQKFGRLAADVEQMTKELREADIHADQLRHRLLGGRTF